MQHSYLAQMSTTEQAQQPCLRIAPRTVISMGFIEEISLFLSFALFYLLIFYFFLPLPTPQIFASDLTDLDQSKRRSIWRQRVCRLTLTLTLGIRANGIRCYGHSLWLAVSGLTLYRPGFGEFIAPPTGHFINCHYADTADCWVCEVSG